MKSPSFIQEIVQGTPPTYPADPEGISHYNCNIPMAMALKLKMSVNSCCF